MTPDTVQVMVRVVSVGVVTWRLLTGPGGSVQWVQYITAIVRARGKP